MSAAIALRREAVTSLDTVVRVSSSYSSEPKGQLVSLLRGCGEVKLAESVVRCHSEFRVLACQSGHRFNPVPIYHCNYRLCVDCARDRQRRAHARLMPVLRAHQRRYPFDRPVLITLTARSTFDSLPAQDKRFKAWFTRLRRTVLWKGGIRGAVAAFEFTWDADKGWHYHAHILAFRKDWIEQSELLAQWTRITEGAGAAGVDIQSKGSLRSMAEETLKYCFKPADIGLTGAAEKRWTAQQVAEFNQLRRVKLSESYGSLRGFTLDAEDKAVEAIQPYEVDEHAHLGFGSPCPDCGSPLTFETVPRAELFLLDSRRELIRGAPSG